MFSPLIATKLRAPRPRADLVPRERLLELVRRGAHSRLTLISAPAGFGKTTLLSQWLAAGAPPRASAWVSLDHTDNEAAAFWGHLIAAIADAAVTGGEAIRPLLSVDLRPDRTLTVALLNALAGLACDLELILDDFHLIEDRAILEEFAFFLDHLSDNIHVVISTRADPPLPLPRLRARGELMEIRTADLRFGPAETADYFAGTMGLALSPRDAEKLEQRTEGWIAALQLAALSVRGRSDVSAFVDSFAGSDRYVFDYLVEEVLRNLPPQIQQFLYGTSMLDRFCADLCDTILDAQHSDAMIEALDQQNLFVVPLDERRQWYRYHHLFADVVAGHMPESERKRRPTRHCAASIWFERHGDGDQAIRHALAAPDVELAARLIEKSIPEMRRRRRDAVLRSSIEALPDALVRARPALSIGLVGPLLQAGLKEGVAARLDEAEALLPNTGDAAYREFIGAIELYRSALAQMQGDLLAAVEHAERVFALAPADAYLERAGAAGFLAIVAWSRGDLPGAERQWAECTDGLVHIGYTADAIGTLYARGQIAIARGRLHESERLFERGLELVASRHGYPVPGSADLHLGLADLSLERGDLAAVRDHLAASESSELAGMPQYPSRRLIVEARLAEAEGDPAGALALLDRAAKIHIGDFFPILAPIPAMKARLNIRAGNWLAVERWQRDREVDANSAPGYDREYEFITLVRLLLAKKDVAAAVAILDRLAPFAEAGGHQTVVIELGVLRALALAARGDGSSAKSELRRALDLAEPQGQARLFLAEGEALAQLLRGAATGRVASDYARSLFAALGAPRPSRPVEHPDLLEPLSDRELDVLKLLRGELSGPEIASELRVSLNTLRTHTKNIYEKLAVNGRRAAVRRAEELNLLRRDKSA
jgi:LuxR family maltose regulon positive regulatory protein